MGWIEPCKFVHWSGDKRPQGQLLNTARDIRRMRKRRKFYVTKITTVNVAAVGKKDLAFQLPKPIGHRLLCRTGITPALHAQLNQPENYSFIVWFELKKWFAINDRHINIIYYWLKGSSTFMNQPAGQTTTLPSHLMSMWCIPIYKQKDIDTF